MKWISEILCLFFVLQVVSACGVKGKPEPPLTPPILGRGEPNYSKATEGVKLKKKTKIAPLDPDWDEPKDFPAEGDPQ